MAGCVEVAISDGALLAGARLPSVRSLARHLRVHPNTVAAAYRDLGRLGLVRSVARSGVWVRRPGLGDPGIPAESGFRRFLAVQRAGGRSVAEVARGLRRWERAVSRRHLFFVEEEPELRSLVVAELRKALRDYRVHGMGLRAVLRRPAAIDGGIVLARPAPAARLEPALSPWTELLPVGVGLGRRERARILGLPTPSVVGVISASRIVRESVRHLAASRPGGGLGCVAASPDDARSRERAARISDLLLVDLECDLARWARRPRQTRLEVRLIEADALAAIARYLGARPRRSALGSATAQRLPP
ncbi:MAG: GntR family transcriptional regulator [Gemmatimonadota bacterium]